MTQNSMILPCKTPQNPIFFLARFARRHPQRSREALINSPKSSQSGREALIEGGGGLFPIGSGLSPIAVSPYGVLTLLLGSLGSRNSEFPEKIGVRSFFT